MKNKLYLLLIPLLFLIPSIQAATLYGTIYDINLDQVSNAIIEINTVPQQQHLSKNGTYSFEVKEGTYTLKAKTGNLSSKETLKVTGTGKFLFDIFLFTSFSEEDEILKDVGGISVGEDKKGFARYPLWKWLLAVGIILILMGRAVLIKKKYDKQNGSQEVNVVVRKEEDITAKKEKQTVITSKNIEPTPLKIDKTNAEDSGEILGDDSFEEEDEEPDYLNQTLEIIKKNEGRITQKKLRKEMMHLSEGKVSLILTELEHKGQIEKVKKGRGNVILLK